MSAPDTGKGLAAAATGGCSNTAGVQTENGSVNGKATSNSNVAAISRVGRMATLSRRSPNQ